MTVLVDLTGTAPFFSLFRCYYNVLRQFHTINLDHNMKIIFQISILILFLATRTVHGQAEGSLFIFTANVSDESTIQLNWETKNEYNSYKFNVERKSITADWKTISSVKASYLSNSPKEYSFNDQKLPSAIYQYRIRIINNDSSFEYSKTVEIAVIPPGDFELSQNYPNPFNPSTTISFKLPAASNTTLKIYDIAGNELATIINEYMSAGNFLINFNAKALPSGVYLYVLRSGAYLQVKKMQLLK